MVSLIARAAPLAPEFIKSHPQFEARLALKIPEEKLQPILNAAKELLQPLLGSGSLFEMRRRLQFIFLPYGNLSAILSYLLALEYESPEELIDDLRKLYAEVPLILSREGPKYLGRKDLRRLLIAYEGLSAYSNSIFRCAVNNDEETAALLFSKIEQVWKASACADAVAMVILGEIERPNGRSLSLLCRTADEHVLKFEDMLLSIDPALRHRLALPAEPTVSFEEVAGDLGLRH